MNSPEIESIIEQAVSSARDRTHEYCTIEHLLLSLITHAPFKKCLDTFGIETDTMIKEVTLYIDNM
jgi:ATP-dependent Clp protease ATP-binding subunit ClpA